MFIGQSRPTHHSDPTVPHSSLEKHAALPDDFFLLVSAGADRPAATSPVPRLHDPAVCTDQVAAELQRCWGRRLLQPMDSDPNVIRQELLVRLASSDSLYRCRHENL
jgi:hypothetical protein